MVPFIELDLDISFNSRYLIDVASQLDGDHIEIYLKDTGSPAFPSRALGLEAAGGPRPKAPPRHPN